jgi:hypothetical protein
MSISSSVDERYRLYATDLNGRPRHVVIANVTYQGLEEVNPVLHFVGQSKRLVLTPAQCHQMVLLTGTALFIEWIGRPIILKPDATNPGAIELASPTALRASVMPVERTDNQRGWRLAWLVVGLVATASALYWVINLSGLSAYLATLLP